MCFIISGPIWLWVLMVPAYFFFAFVMPTATTYVSNHTALEIQGEALGTLSSINAAAMFLSPLCAGFIVGANPALTLWIGGGILILAGIIVFVGSLKKSTEVD